MHPLLAYFSKNYKDLIPRISLVLLIVLAAFIFRDYGISPDEEQQRLIGQTSLKYLGQVFQIPYLLDDFTLLANPSDIFINFKDRDYGVAFEMPVELLIKIIGIKSAADAYYFRHALTFLTFLGAIFAVYSLAKIRYLNQYFGIIAAVFLVLSPRIFGESFFNDKDLVFMSVYTIGIYTLIIFFKAPSYKTALFHAIACGLAVDIRIMGIILPAATLMIGFIWRISNIKNLGRLDYYLLFFICMTVVTVLIFWPWLWADPIGNFILAFKNMSQFRWGGQMYFMGDIINSMDLPWYYIPVWISVTTPPLYLVLFIVGVIAILKSIAQEKLLSFRNETSFQDLIILTLFIGPLATVIFLNSVLYNGWRHLYFIYPALILISIRGLVILKKFTKNKKILSSLLALIVLSSLLWTGSWMIRYHPYQFLYFNFLAGNWSKNFDLDYWGVAYRKPLEIILSKNSGEKLSVFNNMGGMTWGLWQIPYWQNIPLFSQENQSRIDGTQSEKCSDFVITSARGNAKQYSQKQDFHLLDEIKIDGKLVYAIYQRNKPITNIFPLIGKPIDFSDNATHCFLKVGWNDQSEEWGVWSTSTQALIELPLPEFKPKVINLEIKPFVGPYNLTQKITVSLNNLPSKSFKFSQPNNQKLTIEIPKSEQTKNILQIQISIPQAVSPKSLGLSSDGRSLGIGLVSATFE